jgi:phosphatidylserine synthase 2
MQPSLSYLLQEYYEFIDSGQTDLFRKVGTFAWLGMAVAFVETLAAIKFGHGLFPQPWPKHVLIAWGTVATVFLAVFTTWTVRFYRTEGGKGRGRTSRQKRTT